MSVPWKRSAMALVVAVTASFAAAAVIAPANGSDRPAGATLAHRVCLVRPAASQDISTALVIAPKGRVPKGGRPIVAWAHGTTGTAQNCGPSQALNPAQKLNQYFLIGGNSWLDYGVPAIETWLKQGYVTVATDYQGLGGGGAHQYAIATVQGRDVINSVRAVGAMGLNGGTPQGRRLRLVARRRRDDRGGEFQGVYRTEGYCVRRRGVRRVRRPRRRRCGGGGPAGPARRGRHAGLLNRRHRAVFRQRVQFRASGDDAVGAAASFSRTEADGRLF